MIAPNRLPYRFHPAARRELREAILWYAGRDTAAARHLRQIIAQAIDRIRVLPNCGSPYLHSTQRTVIQRYPYSIVYTLRQGELVIIALAHAKRRPGYWRTRLRDETT